MIRVWVRLPLLAQRHTMATTSISGMRGLYRLPSMGATTTDGRRFKSDAFGVSGYTSFYTGGDAVALGLQEGVELALPEPEAKHAVNSLRVQEGDVVTLCDGLGRSFRAEVVETRKAKKSRSQVLVRVVSTLPECSGEPPFDLSVCLPLLKSTSRMEFAIEKATELGVNRIMLFHSQSSKGDEWKQAKVAEKINVNKHRRLTEMVLSAMKQSGRSVMPVLNNELVSFADLIRGLAVSERSTLKVILHPCKQTLADLVAANRTKLVRFEDSENRCIVLLVGPEAGLISEEVELAKDHGWEVASLGVTRLRTETSILAASAVVAGVLT